MATDDPTSSRLKILRGGYIPLPLYGKTPPAYGKNNQRKGLVPTIAGGGVVMQGWNGHPRSDADQADGGGTICA